jgi:hypothetical protein
MQNSLYEFLILNKKISLPGIGTISLRQDPAQLDIGNRQFTSSSFSFLLDTKNDTPSKKLFEWLAVSLGISEWDAIRSVNDFSSSLKNKISEEGKVSWENIGVLSRGNTGDLKLNPFAIDIRSEQPVNAEKVIREKFEHTVLVGEQEKTSVEMVEYFAEETPKRNYAWIVAVAIIVLAVMFIGWYFSEKGFAPSSAGNNAVLKSR